jgi:hypothetical protein
VRDKVSYPYKTTGDEFPYQVITYQLLRKDSVHWK